MTGLDHLEQHVEKKEPGLSLKFWVPLISILLIVSSLQKPDGYGQAHDIKFDAFEAQVEDAKVENYQVDESEVDEVVVSDPLVDKSNVDDACCRREVMAKFLEWSSGQATWSGGQNVGVVPKGLECWPRVLLGAQGSNF
ncbi:hypothetical protein Tco_1554425 [Tanacetum coccineum]